MVCERRADPGGRDPRRARDHQIVARCADRRPLQDEPLAPAAAGLDGRRPVGDHQPDADESEKEAEPLARRDPLGQREPGERGAAVEEHE